jgi:hypothetical protein
MDPKIKARAAMALALALAGLEGEKAPPPAPAHKAVVRMAPARAVPVYRYPAFVARPAYVPAYHPVFVPQMMSGSVGAVCAPGGT